jgi:hypothetical protein
VDSFYRGKMEAFRIFEGVLDQADIDLLYDLSKPNPISGDPFAEWPLESLVGETIQDSTSNQLDFVKINSASIGTGRVGNGLVLNRDNQDSVETDFIPLNSRNYTIAFWIKPGSDSYYSILASECEYQQNGKCLHIGYEPWGWLKVGYWGNDLETDWSDFLVGRTVWTHIGLVYNHSTQKRTIFVNGVPVAQDTSAITPLGTQYGQFCLGRLCMGGGDHFKGGIDQVHVFSTAKSQADIQAIIANEGGFSCQELDLDWPDHDLYHKANGNTNDEWNPSYNGTGNNLSYATGASADCGQAYSFNGSNSYVKINTGVWALGPNDYSVVRAWIKTTQSSKGTIIEQFGGFSGTQQEKVAAYVNNGKAVWEIAYGSGVCQTITSNASVNDGQWHLVVIRQRPGQNVSIFIDGALDISQNFSGCNGYQTVSNASIGAGKTAWNSTNPNTNYFNGQIDDIAVLNRNSNDNELLVMR